ncbi:tetratricopeptide repeat protein [Solilutibacter silvestris]|uniref:tetratricopeptide repeat protein n=1 Tax=Solilutibacter silvestris TaxID=1645665 RepID=UPI003D344A5A
MEFKTLDNEELLRLSLDAMSSDRDADAMMMLKTLLEREPGDANGQYLLAALHAQIGMMDRAEEGFRKAVALAPGMVMARFQLGQLLLVKGDNGSARDILEPLTGQQDSIGAYARGLFAIAGDDVDGAIRYLGDGLALPQAVPALQRDMDNLRARLAESLQQAEVPISNEPIAPVLRMPGAYQGN